MLNVMATLQQRCGNILITSESNIVTTSETDVGATLIFDRATTLSQRQQRRCHNVVTTSLCQLGMDTHWNDSLMQHWKNNFFSSAQRIIFFLIRYCRNRGIILFGLIETNILHSFFIHNFKNKQLTAIFFEN